jgi:hypothetical protein
VTQTVLSTAVPSNCRVLLGGLRQNYRDAFRAWNSAEKAIRTRLPSTQPGRVLDEDGKALANKAENAYAAARIALTDEMLLRSGSVNDDSAQQDAARLRILLTSSYPWPELQTI